MGLPAGLAPQKEIRAWSHCLPLQSDLLNSNWLNSHRCPGASYVSGVSVCCLKLVIASCMQVNGIVQLAFEHAWKARTAARQPLKVLAMQDLHLHPHPKSDVWRWCRTPPSLHLFSLDKVAEATQLLHCLAWVLPPIQGFW